jgi:hypothetical protein
MAKKSNGHGHNSGSLWLTRVVNTIDRDPEIDKFQDIWRRARIKESDLAVLAGLASSTVGKMFGGVTRQPRHSTFAKMAGAMGHRYELVQDEAPDYENELPKAREQFKDHKAALAKAKARRR